jgi:hypothetical protein
VRGVIVIAHQMLGRSAPAQHRGCWAALTALAGWLSCRGGQLLTLRPHSIVHLCVDRLRQLSSLAAHFSGVALPQRRQAAGDAHIALLRAAASGRCPPVDRCPRQRSGRMLTCMACAQHRLGWTQRSTYADYADFKQAAFSCLRISKHHARGFGATGLACVMAMKSSDRPIRPRPHGVTGKLLTVMMSAPASM